MFLVEPPRSQGDILFRLFDYPVRIHPFFWLVAVLLGFQPDGTPPLDLLVWVAVVLISILVHELGHALLQRRYGGHSRIVLYGFGGLAIAENVEYSPRRQILISLAGPAAGFMLALAVVVLMLASGHVMGIYWGGGFSFEKVDEAADHALSFWIANVYWEAPVNKLPRLLVGDLLAVNIFWGLLNLAPIYPLDGGQVSRELWTLKSPSTGIVRSLQLSIAAAVGVVLLALSQQRLFMCFMFGYLAYTNYQILQRYQNSRW